jgi:hypothetical protein
MKQKTEVFNNENWIGPDQWEEYLFHNIGMPATMHKELDDVWHKDGYVEGELIDVLFADFDCDGTHDDVEIYPILVIYNTEKKKIWHMTAYPDGCECMGVINL